MHHVSGARLDKRVAGWSRWRHVGALFGPAAWAEQAVAGPAIRAGEKAQNPAKTATQIFAPFD